MLNKIVDLIMKPFRINLPNGKNFTHGVKR